MTNSASIEELMCVIRSYSEEWGTHNVVLAVPQEWERLADYLTAEHRMRLAFTTDGKIEVSAYDGPFGSRQVHWEVDAQLLVSAGMSQSGQATVVG